MVKPPKFKQKKYEKECDEHFVVVDKPFRNGRNGPWQPADINIIAEWLARAFQTERQDIVAIYTMNTVITFHISETHIHSKISCLF